MKRICEVPSSRGSQEASSKEVSFGNIVRQTSVSSMQVKTISDDEKTEAE